MTLFNFLGISNINYLFSKRLKLIKAPTKYVKFVGALNVIVLYNLAIKQNC